MAKRGDYCVAAVLDGMMRPACYRMARVVKTNRAGFITNICFYNYDNIKPGASNTLGFHAVWKTYAIPREHGDAVAHLLAEEWPTLEEAHAAAQEAITRNDSTQGDLT